MLNFILPTPTPERVASSQFAEAKLSLLQAQAQLEYYTSIVPMLEARVQRLQAYLSQLGAAQ